MAYKELAQLSNVLSFVLGHRLNQGRRAAALVRFVRWQAASRLLPGKAVVEWVNGARLVVGRGEAGLTGNIYCGLHELEDMGFLLHFLRPADLFVDIGANAGSYTVLACAAIGARAISVEPITSTFQRLLDNVGVNHIGDQATCLNIGLSDHPGTLLFSADLDCTNHAIAAGEAPGSSVEVAVRTLDDVVAAEAPILLKIDVEGYEAVVLRGAERTLASPSLHAVIVELNESEARYGLHEGDARRALQKQGFMPYQYDPLTRHFSPPGERTRGGNVLYLRGVDLVVARCETAPPFSILGRKV